MTLMVVCGVLVVAGLAAVVAWGGLDIAGPPGDPGGHGPGEGTPSVGLTLRRLAWHLDIAVVSGLAAGLMASGAGGRLAMRLLAVTAGEGAQGRITEAEEVVGRITTGGTIAFVIFGGLFAGVVTGPLLVAIRRWLPRGRWRGVAFGLLLLVVGATRVEPLRANNRDFDIVGPSWLALIVFSAVVLAHGMVNVAIASRVSRALPLLSRRPAAVLAHLPLVLLLLPSPLVIGTLVVALAAVGLRSLPMSRVLASPKVLRAGRVVLGLAAAVSLPGFLATFADISGRGP